MSNMTVEKEYVLSVFIVIVWYSIYISSGCFNTKGQYYRSDGINFIGKA